ncbi:MAG TPA: hypothetical protein VLJ17_18375 [Xanthobacteraceae bacterium]|nr:hypothetical protein [Xanthobacteraceae bacterium]
MSKSTVRMWRIGLVLFLFAVAGIAARAQDYPIRTVTFGRASPALSK